MRLTSSRSPVDKPLKTEIIRSVTAYPIKDNLMSEIRAATMEDETLTMLREVIHRGWPAVARVVPEPLMAYYHHRDELAVADGVIMRGERVVITTSMRGEMKKRVQTGHMGINSCLRLAKELMFWPGMTSEMRQYVATCGTCAMYGDRQPRETVIATEIPRKPWVKIATDLFSWGGDM